MDVQEIHVVIVGTNGRERKLDRKKVRELADSIREIGLLNPITVCAAGSEYTLVAGRHRLEAAKLLDWKLIPAVVLDLPEADRHLAAIDENLKRNDLSALERGEHLAERKVWYEIKHPETVSVTKRGGPGRGKKRRQNPAVVSYAADTAAKNGVSERSVRQDVQIAEAIAEDVRNALAGTPVADSQTDLLAMARLPEAAQREVVSTVDLTDKTAVREALAARQPAPKKAPKPAPEPEVQTTEIIVTVEAFARAALSLFSPDECGRLISMIREGLRA